VLGVDKGRQAAQPLRLGNDLQGDGGLAGGFRPEDLRDAAAGNAADAQGGVEADGAGGDNRNGQKGFLGAEADDGAFAKLFFDLCEGEFYGFGAVIGDGHWGSLLCGNATLRGSCISVKGDQRQGMECISMGL
jgi:hypothetical protein